MEKEIKYRGFFEVDESFLGQISIQENVDKEKNVSGEEEE